MGFNNVKKKWVPEIQQHAENVPIILVGTKADLRNDQATQDNLQKKGLAYVTTDQANGLAQEIKAKKYIECSALTQEGLKGVFDEAIRAALRKDEKPAKDCCVMI